MTNPLYRLSPRVTDMHDGSFRPTVIGDDGAEGGIKFGALVAKAAKRARASCRGQRGEPLAQLRAGQLGVDQRRAALSDDALAVDLAAGDPLRDARCADVALPRELRLADG